MENIGNILLLSNKIPIRLIKEPFCKICMNPVSKEEDYCRFCIELPLDVDDWYFNRIVSIGYYKTYENRPYNNIPLNILSRMFNS